MSNVDSILAVCHTPYIFTCILMYKHIKYKDDNKMTNFLPACCSYVKVPTDTFFKSREPLPLPYAVHNFPTIGVILFGILSVPGTLRFFLICHLQLRLQRFSITDDHVALRVSQHYITNLLFGNSNSSQCELQSFYSQFCFPISNLLHNNLYMGDPNDHFCFTKLFGNLFYFIVPPINLFLDIPSIFVFYIP